MIKNLNLELSSKARFDSIDGASLVEKICRERSL